MSFVGWIIVAYIAWAVMSAIRKSPAAKVARAARRPPRSQDEAHRQLLEMLGLTQGEPAEVQRRSVPADRTAVRQRSIARASASADVTVDHDDDAERIVRQRRREVEARNRALAGDHHEDFDIRVRREDQEQEQLAGRRSQVATSELRKLIAWQEILGPPVGMRDR